MDWMGGTGERVIRLGLVDGIQGLMVWEVIGFGRLREELSLRV
jgi:hypothetical protein